MSIASGALDVRRAAFRDALRRGDLLAAARAGARLQAHAAALDGREFIAARDTRIALGRSIRDARSRRATVARPVVVKTALPLRRPRRVPYLVAVAIAALAVALSGWLVLPHDLGDGEAGGGGAPAAVVPDTTVPITAQSRGRVVLAVAAPIVEQPQAMTAPEPITVIASPGPAATSGPSAAPGVPGGVPGAGGPGAPGPGSGSGVPSAAPAPTPRPTPPPPLARGFARLIGQVIDTSTGRGLPGACVSLGPCGAGAPRTDANGRWTLDLPVGSGGLNWGLEFAKADYTSSTLNVRSRTGYIFLPTQRLSPTG